MNKPMDFFEAFNFLMEHPIFKGEFQFQLDVEVVKVNPKTKEIDNVRVNNTLTQVWLECGHLAHEDADPTVKYHDMYLDCGGDTYEIAICNLAKLVKKRFGVYRRGYPSIGCSCLIFDENDFI